MPWPASSLAIVPSMCKRRGNIARDYRIVILSGLVSVNTGIGMARRNELALSNVADPGGLAEEESIDGSDINCINRAIAIHIGSLQCAPCERCKSQEMPLHGDHIRSVDASGAWYQSS